MKSIVKKILKILVILIISTIIIYFVFTITAFNTWCTENQISIFFNSDKLNLDKEKIQSIGNSVGNYAQLLEDSLNQSYDEGYHSLAEDFDPLGFSVWNYMRMGIGDVFTRYINISILAGVAIAIAYTVITSKKMNNILKFIVGYFGVILIVPQILSYSYFYRFFDIFDAYYNAPNIIYFYIGYTAIFVLMYLINYKVGIRMARELNQIIKNKKS